MVILGPSVFAVERKGEDGKNRDQVKKQIFAVAQNENKGRGHKEAGQNQVVLEAGIDEGEGGGELTQGIPKTKEGDGGVL